MPQQSTQPELTIGIDPFGQGSTHASRPLKTDYPFERGHFWWSKYRAIVFRDKARNFSYADCWGLVYLIFKTERDEELPSYEHISAKAYSLIETEVQGKAQSLKDFEIPIGREMPFDLVSMTTITNTGLNGWMHIGVVTRPGHVIHMEEKYGVLEQCFRDLPEKTCHKNLKNRRIQLFRMTPESIQILREPLQTVT